MKKGLMAVALSSALLSTSAFASPMIGLVSGANQLVFFDSTAPATITRTLTVTGLLGGDTLLAIDSRPLTGQVYGIGTLSTLYRIDTGTGVATAPGAALTTPLASTNIGFDFNPTVDRIRIFTDTGQNLRVNPDTGALAATDTPLSATGLSGGAYDRNGPGLVQTTLYAINTTTDQLVTIGGINGSPSPNGGVVTPVGSLGVDAGIANGFEIIGANDGYFAAAGNFAPGQNAPQGNASSGFFRVNLATGAASFVGNVPVALSGLTSVSSGAANVPATSPWSLAALLAGLIGFAAFARKRFSA
jgi:hypothetical protein